MRREAEPVLIPIDSADVGRTLGPLMLGNRDPTMRIDGSGVWRASRTPDGPGTIHVQRVAGGVEAEAWGPGAAWLLARAAGMVGAFDQRSSFDPSHHPLVARLARSSAGLRIPRTERVLERLVPTILSQKVTGLEAKRGWSGLVRLAGELAPGPSPLLLPPDPGWLASLPTYAFHRLGIERRRADIIRAAASHAFRLEEAVALGADVLERRLASIRGIGPWTRAEVRFVVIGDADAVSVGDYHLPHMVCWALAGEPRGDDARMLDLLAPFAPHRGRVVRLLEVAGLSAPRYGPRQRVRSIAAI
jgi:3-methyladenine DNA glycosylase/8-oxoguanine DNA glycosylase